MFSSVLLLLLLLPPPLFGFKALGFFLNDGGGVVVPAAVKHPGALWPQPAVLCINT